MHSPNPVCSPRIHSIKVVGRCLNTLALRKLKVLGHSSIDSILERGIIEFKLAHPYVFNLSKQTRIEKYMGSESKRL